MKVLLIIVLCSLLAVEGCYSSYTLNEEERLQNHPKEDESILITLSDGSTIESDGYHHIEVKDPADFVYIMAGERFDRKTGKHESFRGQIKPATIDSIDVDTILTGGPTLREKKQIHCYIFGLSDSSNVRCQRSDCFTVTSKQGAGLWCVGRMESERSSSAFSGMISDGNIKQIEVNEISIVKTSLLLVGIGVSVASIAGGGFNVDFSKVKWVEK